MREKLITKLNSKSPVSEMFRTFRTNLQFMNPDKELETILITSTMPNEGKSLISANLAITYAQAEKRVLLIDADMRNGVQDILFQTEKAPGLSNLLAETGDSIKLKQYIKTTEIPDLFLIPAGNIPPNPAELLARKKTEKIIELLKDSFDVVIFDGTPSLLVTDATILSRMVEATVIVAAYKSTKKENLEKVKKLIENVGGNVIGVVFNKVQVNAKTYESSYYYGNKSNFEERKNRKSDIRDIV